MREIAANAALIQGQPMFKVIDKVKLLEAQGRDIVHLEIGDPDFTTPRHIIDFMVEVMDPKKNETIMDPACGTAGFLFRSSQRW